MVSWTWAYGAGIAGMLSLFRALGSNPSTTKREQHLVLENEVSSQLPLSTVHAKHRTLIRVGKKGAIHPEGLG